MTDRRSRWFPSRSSPWPDSLETRLLYQDFHTGLVPYRHDPEPYSVTADGVSPWVVEDSLTLGEHGHRLDGFVSSVACRLLTHHEVWLEVAFDAEPSGRSARRDTAFRVFEVDGVGRGMGGASLVQQLPTLEDLPQPVWGEYEQPGDWGKQILLDRDRMVQVSLPAVYPSDLLSRVVSDLSTLDPNVTPRWVTDSWVGQNPGAPRFDLTEVIRTHKLRVAQAALPIGWTGRESYHASPRTVSDFYHYSRELRFLHFKAALRAKAEEEPDPVSRTT